MKSINIKGRDYVMINERIKFFREPEEYKGWSLRTEILSHENGKILMVGIIENEKGVIISTGHAQEKEGDGFINKSSYVENCETSAWGRALGNLGIGIDASIASAEEVQNAMSNQNKPELIPSDTEKWDKAIEHLNEGGSIPTIRSKYYLSPINEELLKEKAIG